MNDKESVVKMNDKLDTRSLDVEDVERQKLKSVFPQCFEEGKLDVERLLTLCGKYSDEKDHEKYHFEWKGKQECYQLAAKRTMATLRPCKEESVNFDETDNLYIEGDNLEVIKVLQKSYYNKIKMIYIDPPYNTGHDFVYNDDFKDPLDRYKEITSQTTKSNPESMGRFHTAWLNMMLPRLRLASNLLREDGVIFISIDDHEVHNLRKICDEVFGEENFVAQICHKHRDGVSNDKIISSNHNFLLFYCKDINVIHGMRNEFGIKRIEMDFKNYNKDDNDGKGLYALNPVTGPGGARKGNPYYEFLGISNYWRFSKERMIKMWEEGLIVKLNNNLYQKTYKNDIVNTKKSITTWWDTVGTTAKGTKQIKDLFDTICFDFAKPIELIKYILDFIPYKRNDIILDFFSGSATTAEAVMEINKEDGGNRKFIMVQLPELCDEKSEAFKAGYKNICEIGKERIRRAGEKLLEKDNQMSFEENKKPLDVGFKVFKLDSSNLKAWDSSPIDKETYDDYEQLKLEFTKRFDEVLDRIKPDRSDLDVVYEVMFKLGIEPTEKITKMDFDGKVVYSVREDCLLLVCLDNDMQTETVEKMAELAPAYMVFSQKCFKDVSSMSNIKLLLKRKKIEMKFI